MYLKIQNWMRSSGWHKLEMTAGAEDPIHSATSVPDPILGILLSPTLPTIRKKGTASILQIRQLSLERIQVKIWGHSANMQQG